MKDKEGRGGGRRGICTPGRWGDVRRRTEVSPNFPFASTEPCPPRPPATLNLLSADGVLITVTAPVSASIRPEPIMSAGV